MVMKASSTQGIALSAWADVAAAATLTPAAYDLFQGGTSGPFSGVMNIFIARRTGSAFTATWPRIYILGSASGSSGPWVPLANIVPAVGATIVNTTLNGAVSASATSIVVASGSNIASGDILFIGDSSTTNYELAFVKSVSGTTIYLWDALVNSHSNGAVVTDQAEMYPVPLDLAPWRYIRVVCDNQGSGQNIAFRALLNLHDSNT